MSVFLPLRQLRAAAAVPVLAVLFAGANALAQVTYDAEIPLNSSGLTTALSAPGAMALTSTGTLYMTDGARVIEITPTGVVVGSSAAAGSLGATMTPITSVVIGGTSTNLNNPTALAVDSLGDLYIADTGLKEVLEMTSPSNGGTAIKVSSYTGTDPVSLAVDPSNDLYVADYTGNKIYEITGAAGGFAGANPKTITVTNPVGLTTDSSGNLYYAEATGNDNIYEYQGSGTPTTFLSGTTYNFAFGANNGYPTGMGFDTAGDFYVLSSGSQSLYEFTFSGGTVSEELQIPLSANTENPESIAVGVGGTLYLSDTTSKTTGDDKIYPTLYELFYKSSAAGTESITPVNFGPIPAGANSPYMSLNYLISTEIKGTALYQSMSGDNTGEFIEKSESGCTGTLAKNNPATCTLDFYVNYSSTTPGLRSGVYGVSITGGTVFAIPTIGISEAGAVAVYPGVQSLVGTGHTFTEPEGVAVSGDGGLLFVSDEGGNFETGAYKGSVWLFNQNSGTSSQVGNTSVFNTPTAVALDAAGNLYVADYTNGNVTVIPPGSGSTYDTAGTTLVLQAAPGQTAVALTHPMSLTFDPSGNLFIGDMGSAGINATAAAPGYIVEVPAGGGPAVKLDYTINTVPVVFPQALTADQYGNLFVADGGDGNTDLGGVDVVNAPISSTSTATAFPKFPNGSLLPQLNQPGGLGFDAAGDLYVLDSFNSAIDVFPITYSATGTPQITTTMMTNAATLGFGSSGIITPLITPSSMAVWPTGNAVTVTDLGFQNSSGISNAADVLTLSAQNSTTEDVSSGSYSFQAVNVGNVGITFGTDQVATNGTGTFSLSNSGCGFSGSTLAPGEVASCSPIADYTGGSGVSTATITLTGDASDNSNLGNVLYLTAEPSEPVAELSGTTVTFDRTITVTLADNGSVALALTSISFTNFTNDNTGSCKFPGTLAANSSCTIVVTFTGSAFQSASLTVTDNNDFVTGSKQTFSSYLVVSLALSSDTFGSTGLSPTAGKLTNGSALVSTSGVTGKTTKAGELSTVAEPEVNSKTAITPQTKTGKHKFQQSEPSSNPQSDPSDDGRSGETNHF